LSDFLGKMNLTLVPIKSINEKKCQNISKKGGQGVRRTPGKGKRELKNLVSSVNYEGKKKSVGGEGGKLIF